MDPLLRSSGLEMSNSRITIDELAVHLGHTRAGLELLAHRLPQGVDYRSATIRVGHRYRRILMPLVLYDSTVKRLRMFLERTTRYRPPGNVFGFIKGKSSRDNARAHLDQDCVLKIDLRHFFDSVSRSAVLHALIRDGYAPDVCSLITELTTPEGYLATGLSTSPHLSNLVFEDTDRELTLLASTLNLNYTRYVDDLSFSGSISDADAQELSSVIWRGGWTINEKKTVFMRRGHKQYVTGLSVTDPRRPHAPRSLKRRMRWKLHVIENLGYDEYMDNFGGELRGEFPNALMGLARYVAGLEPTLGGAWLEKWERALPAQWNAEDDDWLEWDEPDWREDYLS
jgi:RNA-directed DNA polymerase